MNDTKGQKASWDDLNWMRMELCRALRKKSGKTGLAYLMDKECMEIHRIADEELCLRMGWTKEEHDRVEHEAIMAEIDAQTLSTN